MREPLAQLLSGGQGMRVMTGNWAQTPGSEVCPRASFPGVDV